MNNKKDVVRSFVDATNNKNWSEVMNLVHDDFIRHSSSEPKEIKTNRKLIEFHKGELKVFPDIQETVVFAIE